MSDRGIEKKTVKQIFEDMDYGVVRENCDLALAWLAQHDYEFCKFPGDHEEIFDISSYGDENIRIEVYGTSQSQLEEIIKKSEAQLKTWLSVPAMEKAKLLNRLAAEIDRHSILLSQLELIFNGAPIKSKSFRLLVEYLQYYARWASLIEKEFADYKPYGVCGVSVGGTNSLGALGAILAPALAAGNIVILSVIDEFAPIAVFIEELCKNVGFPDGVINVVVYKTLPCVEVLNKMTILQHVWSQDNIELQIKGQHSFTMLHVGYSSMVVFDNADLDSACDKICEIAWPHTGMFPWVVRKLLVQESVFEEFVTMLKSKVNKLQTNYDPMNKSLDIASSLMCLNHDVEYFNRQPVIIGNKEFDTQNCGAKCLHIVTFRTANEAAALANNSPYGFATSVWTENISLANEMTAKLKMGIVWINTHGHIASNASFTPYKNSGRGYFGGREGLLEYLTYSKTNDFQPVQVKKTEDGLKAHLPGPVQNKRIFLYYGGAFKKSESGLTEYDNEFPNRKDIRNCVEAARKGYESWNKLSHKVRGQILWKLAENSESIKCSNQTIVNKWMEYLYEWSVLCDNTDSLVQYGTPTLRIVKESVGILAVELHSDTNYALLKLIIAALAYGNAVIILDFSHGIQDFLVELGKLVSTTGIPAGVFNIIFNPNTDCIESLQSHRELETYFRLDKKTECNKLGFELKAKYYTNVNFNSRRDILNMVTKNKCVWTNVGESFL